MSLLRRSSQLWSNTLRTTAPFGIKMQSQSFFGLARSLESVRNCSPHPLASHQRLWTAASSMTLHSHHSNHQTHQNTFLLTSCQRRNYTPMTKDEEEAEKQRLETLTPFARDQELRKLNREIARLEKLRGMNTGELYTWTGRYKTLARDYGTSLVVYYGVAWASTAVMCYGVMTVLDVDALALLGQVDAKLGWDLCSKVSPEMGKVGVVLILNEFLEVVRLPLVVLTVKPVIDKLYPPKM